MSKTKITFDLILIKQTIHLVKKSQINNTPYQFVKINSILRVRYLLLSLDPQKE